MKNLFQLGLACGGLLLALAVGRVTWAQASLTDKAALKQIEARLKSVKTNDRVEALRRLKDHPTTDGIALLFERGLRDKQPDVRNAGLDTLFALKNDAGVCRQLTTFMQVESGRKQPSPDTSAALAILFSSELPEAQAASQVRLDSQMRTPAGAQRFFEDLVGVWRRNAQRESLPQLVRLAKSDVAVRNFAFHRALVQSLIRFQDADAIESLIDLLADAKGEVRLDILRHLRGVSGEKLGFEVEAWRGWWKLSKEEFRPPAQYSLPTIDSLADGATAHYYGLPLYAQRLVFVLDTSGSMAGVRLEAAKAELHKALEALPASAAFGIVVFNSDVNFWQKQLVPATPEAKRAAHLFVAGQPAAKQTATYDALEAAFLFDAEAIYFLSDGAPTQGQILRPPEIVSAISRRNRGRMISLYTIGVGDELRGPSGALMQQLAEQNFGVYRSVR